MGKQRKFIAVLLASVLTLNTPVAFAGGWVDDWLTQKTSSGPGYYQGQQRGYAVGGSFNARWQSGTDYPISVNPPKFSAGCGGISAFEGSVSLLNIDMLVAKLQRVLQNSAGVAFNMAIETVCPKCANIMNVMESVSNQLNSMSMNDCSMAKGLTVGLVDASKTMLNAYEKGTMASTVEKGLEDGYQQTMRSMTGGNATDINGAMDWLGSKLSTPAGKDPLKTGCPTAGSKYFPDKAGADVYVFDKIGADLGLPSDHTNALRGLIGDIVISNASKGYDITVVQACAQNNTKDGNLDIEAFKKGTIWQQSNAGACTQVSDTNKDLVTYVTNTMNSIATKMKAKTAITITSAEGQFINNSPIPIVYALKVGIGAGQENVIISGLAEVTASAYAIASLRDLTAVMSNIYQIAEVQNSRIMNKNTTDCNLSVHYEELLKASGTINTRITKLNTALGNQLNEGLRNYNEMQALVSSLREFSLQLKNDLATRFGASVAQRAIKG